MKFTRTKKLVFFNNKGGVGKTTLAYNTAIKFAKKGYKTVLVDLDPQCNLSKLALGDYFEENLLSSKKNIYEVLSGIVEGGSDINLDVQFEKIGENNLYLLPGSLKLSKFENLLITSYNQAAAGEDIGYFQTSAILRFLRQKGLSEEVDIFIIDTSPSLALLNRVIFLGSDYFLTPLMPDAFSLQGIENLGTTFESWRENWKNTGKAMAGNISHDKVLPGESVFIGYVINSYNQYARKPIKSHTEWIRKIPDYIKQFISEKHSKNGLVKTSYENPLAQIKDYGELPADSQDKNKAIFDLIPGEDFPNVKGVLDNWEKSDKEFDILAENILEVLNKY